MQTTARTHWRKNVLTGIVFFAFGFIVSQLILPAPATLKITKLTQGRKGLINPLLGFDITNPAGFKALQPLTDAIKKEISSQTKVGGVNAISVYFKEVNSADWAGVNENDRYYPASLFKVPVMFYYLKQAETNPAILTQLIPYTATLDAKVVGNDQNFPPALTLEVGTAYSIDEMLSKMITGSDNRSASVLFNGIEPRDLSEIFTDIGLPSSIDNDRYTISPKQYALFFRFLYNATYLNQKMSQKALELLSKSDFQTGLTAQLPAGTVVAHKFGNYTNDATKEEELHDCGIVYYDPDPYFICVMTRGKDGNQEMRAIQEISRIAFADVSSRHQ